MLKIRHKNLCFNLDNNKKLDIHLNGNNISKLDN